MSNYSRQREEIYHVLKCCKTHPNVSEIYEMVKQSGSSASKSTIYRNLKVLCEEGSVIKIEDENGGCHYDCADHLHCHALCKCCGKIFDFEYKDILRIKKSANQQLNGNFDEISVLISGVCSDCNKL